MIVWTISSLAGSRIVEKSADIKHKGIEYKGIVLSITTIEIFDGINIYPLNSFQYLIWAITRSVPFIYALAKIILSLGAILSIVATFLSAMRGPMHANEINKEAHQAPKEK